MSLLFRVAYAVECVAHLLPRTLVGRMFVTEEDRRQGAPWFEVVSDDLGGYVVGLGSVVAYYSPPSARAWRR